MSLRSCAGSSGAGGCRARLWTLSASSKITGSICARSETSRFHMQQVHRLAHPGVLHALAVVGRMPGLADHRAKVVALDQHAALFVHGEVRRADHALATALGEPLPRPPPAARRGPPGRPRTPGSRTSPICWRDSRCRRGRSGRVMRPTTRPSRRARKYSASPWLKKAFIRRFRKIQRSSFSGGTHSGWLACRRNGRWMKAFRSRLPETAVTSTPMPRHPRCPPR